MHSPRPGVTVRTWRGRVEVSLVEAAWEALFGNCSYEEDDSREKSGSALVPRRRLGLRAQGLR
jgi:hypothetical protein